MSDEVALGGSMELGVGPNPGGLLGQAQVVVDPNDADRVYMLASVNPPGSDPMDVHIVRSTNGGGSFSPPIPVNHDAGSDWQWFGTVGVGSNGRIDVVWNDTRNSGQSNLGQTFYSYSTDGGYTFSRNVAVTPQWNSFVGWPNQSKIGDYYDIKSDRFGADLAFSTTLNNEQDVYYMRLFPDCNGNGVSDPRDIDENVSDDTNGNDVPDDCELDMQPPDPGQAGQANTFSATLGNPGETVFFLRSADVGFTNVPGCPGVTIGMDNAKVLGSAVVDGGGTASLTRNVPGGASGQTTLLQAVEKSTCTVSQTIEFTFP